MCTCAYSIMHNVAHQAESDNREIDHFEMRFCTNIL